MESLYFRLREFLAIDSMFLAEREMHSGLPLIEVDIRQGSRCGDSRVDPHTELSYYDFSFEGYHIVIELLECQREVRRGKYASMLDNKLEWITVTYREVFIRKCLDKTSAMHTREVDRLCEDFTDRECPSFIRDT